MNKSISASDLKNLEDYFVNEIAFNKLLGLQIQLNPEQPDQATISFAMREELLGNPFQRILHGGVISSALDLTGGIVACLGMIQKLRDHSREHIIARLSKLGTIDLRIDYLRPGRGEHFTATGYPLRTGNKVAVTRMELHNEQQILIAAGTGTYLVG